MKMKHAICVLLAFLLVFMVTVSPVLGGVVENEKKDITIIKGDGAVKEDTQENEKKDTTSTDDSVTDKIISDNKIFGYDRNKDYDITKDVSVKTAVDLASSLPPWKLGTAILMLLFIVVLITYIIVIQWNLFKGGKAATNENPQKAAQGIRDSKMINRAYTEEMIEGALFICFVVFAVMLFS